jgi:hypothetical protein
LNVSATHRHGSQLALRSSFLPTRDWIGAPLEDGEGQDLAVSLARLRALVSRAEVREALFVEAGDLWALAERWLASAESLPPEAEHALVRFVSRLSLRASPYTPFSGWNVVEVADHAEVRFNGSPTYQKRVYPGAEYLSRLSTALEPIEELLFHPTPGIARAGRCWHVLEHRPGGGYAPAALAATPELELLLARARGGATLRELHEALEGAAPADEVVDFVAEAVNTGLLTSEFGLVAPGTDPIRHWAARLEELGRVREAAELRAALAALGRSAAHRGPEAYRDVVRHLEDVGAGAPSTRAWSVAVSRHVEHATLPAEVVDEVCRGIDVLRRVADTRIDPFRGFRARFASRFGDQEVPLAIALDPDTGIGFHGTEKESFRGPPRDAVLRALHARATGSGALEVDLTAEEIQGLAPMADLPLPPSFSVDFSVASGSPDGIARGDFQVFIGGISAPPGMGDLASASLATPEMEALLLRHLRAEEAAEPDSIFAEVVSVPGAGEGRLPRRPLRQYEIPYLGTPGVDPACQIPLGDLRVSVRHGRVVLRSASLDRVVEPRVTVRHDYWAPHHPPILRFLALHARQGHAVALWDWGTLRQAEFLPRVRVGRTVLTRARWRIDPAAITELAAHAGRMELVRRWRAGRGIPRFVATVGKGGECVVDFADALSVGAFVEGALGAEPTLLVELSPSPEGAWIGHPGAAHAGEFVLPFTRRAEGPLTPYES